MPQDFPVEAGEMLAFTPESLKSIPNAPKFILRAATQRTKRFQRRILIEEGLRTHSLASVREEVLSGLSTMWSADAFEEHAPKIRDYWAASDDFQLQKKDNPDLEWSYDAEIEKAVKALTQRVSQAWPPLRAMIADNSEYSENVSTLLAAVVILDVKGLDVTIHKDRGYLTFDCAGAIEEALQAFEGRHAKEYGLTPGMAVLELFVACGNRMKLDGEEEKNSASPLPSPTIQAPSMETEQEKGGKSRASARSKKTPATA